MDNDLNAELLKFPFHRSSATDLPEEYRTLRERAPVAQVRLPTGSVGYIVTRYDDAKLVLSDARFSRADTIKPGAPRLSAMDFPPGSLFTLDPPQHTRLRKFVSDRFTPAEMRRLSSHVETVTDAILDGIAATPGVVDLNEHLAFPLPVILICELLGVPSGERALFRSWADASVALTADPTQSLKRQQEMFAYLGRLVHSKRETGGEGLLAQLVQAQEEDDPLTEYELIVLAMSILVAGFETTASVIGTGIMTLLRRPEIVARIRDEPAYIEPVVEEILRFNPIGDGGPIRITQEDVTIAGTLIPQGSLVIASVSSANMDDRAFPAPQTFDPERNAARHLAFGHGVHFCLGASLARLELRTAISKTFERFPDLRMAVPFEDLRMKQGMLFHRLEKLPVTTTRAD